MAARGRSRSKSFYDDDDDGDSADANFEDFGMNDAGWNPGGVDFEFGDDDDQDQEEDMRVRRRSRTFYSETDPASGAPPPVQPLGGPPLPRDSMDLEPPDTGMLNRHGPLKPNEVKALQQGLTEAAKAGGHNRDDSNLSDLSLSNIAQSPVAATQKKEPRHLKKFKILMLGDSAVGKTSLINRFVEDKFAHNLVGTVGVDFKMKRMWLGPTKEMCTVQIWDTAGQERFHRITKTYYRGANAIYLTFDCSSQDSLDNLEYWVQNIKDNASDDVLVLLAANKIDLRETESPDKATEISGIVRRGQDIASQYGIEYFETSAKTGDGVEASFTRLADIAFEKLSREAGAEGGAASSAAGTPGSDGKKKGKKDCVIQ